MKFVKNHENRETISRGCLNNRKNVDTRLDMSCDRLEHKTFRLWSVVTSCVPTKTYWTHSVCLIKLGANSHVLLTAAWEALLLGSLLKRLRDTSNGDRDRLTHSQARSRFLRSDAMELVGARRCRARARVNFRQGVGGTSIFQIPTIWCPSLYRDNHCFRTRLFITTPDHTRPFRAVTAEKNEIVL